MISAASIIETLIARGVIAPEFKDEATVELHRELSRRSRRVAQTLAALTSVHQLAVRVAYAGAQS